MGFISNIDPNCMLENIKQLSTIEPKFQNIIDEFGLPEIKTRPQGFVALVQLILEQQVSIASAEACFRKIESKIQKVEPLPLLSLSDEELKACGVSRQKINYLKNLAEQIILQTFDPLNLEQLSEKEAFQELVQLKGIGKWTAEVYLMFCLQKKNIFPIGDIAIQRAMTDIFDCKTTDEMLLKANHWEPYRTLASYLLWHYYLGKRNRL